MSNFFESVKVPKIVKPIKMAEYDAVMSELPDIFVWANPPKELIDEYRRIQLARTNAVSKFVRLSKHIKILSIWQPAQDAYLRRASKDAQTANADYAAWLSEIWSQGEPETRVTPEKVKESQENIAEQDGLLWNWILDQTAGIIVTHNNRDILEKN